MTMIETSRLRLRNWQDQDLEPLVALNSDSRVMEFFPSLINREESQKFIERAQKEMSQRGYCFFAAELKADHSLAGIIGIHFTDDLPFSPCVEIGWRLAHDYWGQGLATEGAQACLEFGFNRLNLAEIVSLTSAINLKSRRVMEKIGMHYDPSCDFDHPRIEPNHILQRHVLYRISR